LKVQKPFSAFFADDAIEHAVTSPLCTYSDETLLKTIELMEEKRVWDLPVINNEGQLLGLLHLHPAIKALLNSKES
jgi:arabinose-5-phosphate isomerase